MLESLREERNVHGLYTKGKASFYIRMESPSANGSHAIIVVACGDEICLQLHNDSPPYEG